MGIHGPDCDCKLDVNDAAVIEVANTIKERAGAFLRGSALANAVLRAANRFKNEHGEAMNQVDVRVGAALALVTLARIEADRLKHDFGIEIFDVHRPDDAALKN